MPQPQDFQPSGVPQAQQNQQPSGFSYRNTLPPSASPTQGQVQQQDPSLQSRANADPRVQMKIPLPRREPYFQADVSNSHGHRSSSQPLFDCHNANPGRKARSQVAPAQMQERQRQSMIRNELNGNIICFCNAVQRWIMFHLLSSGEGTISKSFKMALETRMLASTTLETSLRTTRRARIRRVHLMMNHLMSPIREGAPEVSIKQSTPILSLTSMQQFPPSWT
ncbi:hypothetical protein FGO68_gene9726 [Halteria grandinella]|uniref:Uncharacterized protein n=1 Tax=Halteria grandinella TaxID=5974 RepID=A0A8J8NN58_HALGN|nr:hypothetical protein FGO68_gene9726 [Halteria grandinella]